MTTTDRTTEPAGERTPPSMTPWLWLVGAVLGESMTRWLVAACCVACFLWVRRSVPATKGRSLEEIERMWEGATAG